MRILVTALSAILFHICAHAQSSAGFKWQSPLQAGFAVLEGQGWPSEAAEPYDRLPARAEKLVRKEVWGLSRNSAGLMLRFSSNAGVLKVRYQVKGNQAMPHMPATGVSGVDLYTVDCDGQRLWCAGAYHFGDTIEYSFLNLQSNGVCGGKEREYRLYLPLYNTVSWMEIGTQDSAALRFLPARTRGILVYGTSIAQGACASRPGMAWTAILGRKLDVPLINLGFSGNGRMEKEVVDLVNEIDAEIYVLDCLPNMVGLKEDELKARITAAVGSIRSKHKTPILLVEHAGYPDGAINHPREEQFQNVNKWMKEVYEALKKDRVKDIYYLSKEEIGLGLDMTVDGTHPTDWGMETYANAYAGHIRKILKRG